MLEKINDIWTNYINSIKESIGNAAEEKLNELLGNCLVSLGSQLQKIAVIIIVIGVLLWIFKRTKVFRMGIISYLIGLLIELLGLTMLIK